MKKDNDLLHYNDPHVIVELDPDAIPLNGYVNGVFSSAVVNLAIALHVGLNVGDGKALGRNFIINIYTVLNIKYHIKVNYEHRSFVVCKNKRGQR